MYYPSEISLYCICFLIFVAMLLDTLNGLWHNIMSSPVTEFLAPKADP